MKIQIPRYQDVRVGYYNLEAGVDCADVLRQIATDIDQGLIFHALHFDGDRFTLYWEEEL